MVRVLCLLGVLVLGWVVGPGSNDENPLRNEGANAGTVASAAKVVPADENAFMNEEADRPQFAQDRVAAQDKAVPFDGKRAMGYLEKICDLGPRMSGTKEMTKQQEIIIKHFEEHGATVRKQTFKAKQLSKQNAVEMTNLIVSWFPDRKKRLILCAHYDTRPIADQEKDPRKWRDPFVSANDGGSGVALMMELGHHMKDLKTNVGVDFVFFDGEEFVWNRTDEYFFGSKHFAQQWLKNKRQPEYQAAILLDMIAGHNARFPAEQNSLQKARPLVNHIWQIAAELKCTAFKNEIGDSVLDDHIALQNAGIPAIDIIDFSYKHWHKLTDTPDNCSPETMTQVARVLTTWMQRAK